MDPIGALASIITILQLSQKVIGYLNDVKDASKDGAKCAIEASNLYTLLRDLRCRLEEGRGDTPWHTAVRALGVENGPFDQFKQTLESLQSKMAKRGVLKQAGKALMWKFTKEDINNLLNRMERLKSLIEIALQMDHYKLSLAIKEDADVIRAHVPAIQMGLGVLREDRDHVKHDKLVEWISPIDFPAQQSDIIGRRQKGTGQWFLDDPAFTKWVSEPKATLFCPGIPGAGKTMMAAIAIDHLSKAAQSSTVGIAYVYCNYKARGEQDAASLLAAILKQLLRARPSVAEPVEQLYTQYARLGTRPSTDEIFGALQSVLAEFSTVHVVIDALDECRSDDGTRGRFLARIQALQAKVDMRLMVTSRILPDIVGEFAEGIRLEVRASEEDVRQFVAGQIDRLPKCIQRDATLRDMVQEKVAKAVDGMFLLARLHIDSLLDKRTKSKVVSTLETMSKGFQALQKSYEDALERIKGQLPGDAALARRVISWITYTHRALTTLELQHALAVQPGQDSLDLDNILEIEDIVSVCAGLVVVDEESNIIRLVHYTTQEYFERARGDWDPTAQKDITMTCLSYLSFDAFKDGSCGSDGCFKERCKQNPLLDYAARYWGRHALTVQKSVSKLAAIILRDCMLVSCITQMMFVTVRRYEGHSQKYPRGTAGLHLAAHFGLLHLVQHLLERQGIADVDTKTEDGRTPLSWAAEGGHQSVVEFLVDREDVEADSKDKRGRSPLSWAAGKGHEEIVKLLVNRDDVKADSIDGQGRTPLSWAAGKGHEAVVKLLVDRDDVKTDSKNISGRTPLSFAAGNGHEMMVKLLVARDDVNPNSMNRNRRRPRDFAERRGHHTVVMLLSDKMLASMGISKTAALRCASGRD